MSDTQIPPATTAEAQIVPPGYVQRFDENGRPVLLRAEDAPAFERQHGFTAERYDIPSAAVRFNAAFAAVPQTVSDAIGEFQTLGYVRDEQAAALNANLGEFVDAYRFLMTCVGLLPREAAVADVAHLQETGGLAALGGAHPARAVLPLAEKLPPERLALHRQRWAADAAAREAGA